MDKTKLMKVLMETLKAFLIALLTAMGVSLTSCGTTKAYISRPAEGTQTTITITTNNPITTNVDPTTSVDFKSKKD